MNGNQWFVKYPYRAVVFVLVVFFGSIWLVLLGIAHFFDWLQGVLWTKG